MLSEQTSPKPLENSAALDLEPVATLVAEDLHQVEAILQREIRSQLPEVHRVLEHVQYYRGKRLRPILLLLSAKLCGSIRPEHRLLAAVLEMIHTATLIHDDILDAARLRRHLPTLHTVWGVPAAILAGDFLFSHAFTLASQTGNALACQLIGQATNRVCEGEMQQTLRSRSLDLSLADYFAIIRSKTAELTSLACRLGAVFAAAPTPLVEALSSYGLHLGLAFQIADDVLDLLGDEQRTGKSLGTDWQLYKPTLPILYWRDSLPPDQRATYMRAWQQGLLTLEELRTLLHQSGAVSRAWLYALDYVQSAQRALAPLPDGPERRALQLLAQFTISRDF